MSRKDMRKRLLNIVQEQQTMFVPIELLEEMVDDMMKYYNKSFNDNSTDKQLIMFYEKFIKL